MSMMTNPFGTPVAEAPTAPTASSDQAAESSRRNRLIAMVIGVALVIGIGASLLLFAGDGPPVPAAVPFMPGAPRVAAAAPTTAPPVTQIKKQAPAKARNPFLALVTAPVTTVGGMTSGTSGGVSGVIPGLVPAAAPSGTASGSPGATAPGMAPVAVGGGGTEASPGVTPGRSGGTGMTSGGVSPRSVPVPLPPAPQVKVTMAAVSSANTSAKIAVDGKSFTVKPLEQFGSFFTLLNLRDGSCGAIQFGDVVFDLCEGGSRTVS